MAAEVSGQPAGLEAGCYSAGLSLVRIVDSAAVNGREDALTSRQLVAAFFDRLIEAISSPEFENGEQASLKRLLVRIYEQLLKRVPQGARLDVPTHSRLVPYLVIRSQC